MTEIWSDRGNDKRFNKWKNNEKLVGTVGLIVRQQT